MLVTDQLLVENLVKTLAGQRALYRQLLELARNQSRYVATGENESLMTVLAARRRLLDQVAPLDRQLQPFKGRWQEVLDTLAPADRTRVADLLREVQQLLGEILAQDEIDKESLLRQKTDVGSELRKTVTGAALHRAYGVRR